MDRKIIVRKKIEFGKIDYYGHGRRINMVDVDIEVRTWNGYPEMSICGGIWNGRHTDYVCCGQCLDEIKDELIRNRLISPKFFEIYNVWKNWHLKKVPEDVIEWAKGV